MTACPASDSAWMLARRYHDDRCQNRFAAASASSCVASSRSAPAAHGGAKLGSSSDGQSLATLDRLKASVTGHIAFVPNPSASRWYDVSSPFVPPPEKTVRIVTFCPSSRRLAMRPPQESATSSG